MHLPAGGHARSFVSYLTDAAARSRVNLRYQCGVTSYHSANTNQTRLWVETMSSELRNALLFAHRTNIDRYRRLLTTYVTVNEREFVERRVSEEEEALQNLARKAALEDCLDSA
jgi:hypothetical protein